jgi:hypothetical protein
VRVQHILLVDLFRRLYFVPQAMDMFMFIVAMFICGEFLSSASKQWWGNVCHLRLGILDYFFGLMYSRGNGFGNKTEVTVTLIAHCVLVKLIHPVPFRIHFFFFSIWLVMFTQLLR